MNLCRNDHIYGKHIQFGSTNIINRRNNVTLAIWLRINLTCFTLVSFAHFIFFTCVIVSASYHSLENKYLWLPTKTWHHRANIFSMLWFPNVATCHKLQRTNQYPKNKNEQMDDLCFVYNPLENWLWKNSVCTYCIILHKP